MPPFLKMAFGFGMLHSLEDMRSSSALPSDHIVLGEYQKDVYFLHL
jgi:hypothetical protein